MRTYSKLQKITLGVLVSSLVISSSISLGRRQVDAQTPSIPDRLLGSSSITVREVGTVDPSETVEITVVNNLSGTLGIGFSGGPKVTLDPDDEEVISFPPESAPFNLFIYPLGFDASVKYDVSLTENMITLEADMLDDTAPGDRSINVDLEGNVYVF